MPTLTLAVSEYRCEDCRVRGVPARELVRMIPRAAVMNGKLVGEEWWCCAVCFDPKFDVKTRKPRGKRGSTRVGTGSKRKQVSR